MAYSTLSAPTRGTLYITTFTNIAAAFGNAIAGFFGSLSRAMIVNSTAQQRLQQVERLQAKTDAELAAIDIKREDIVHHVFRDLFWN